MKLTQLFLGETHMETKRSDESGRFQPTPAQAANISRQIHALKPGQTISGEVISRNGSEVQIKLSEDMVLNARVDRNLNIEIGKNMTFEVKNNGTSLTLSPLFTNVSTDVNVLKALDMAGLPVNEASVNMTEQMMAAGMSVNRNYLLQVYREINNYPQAAISDIINLHKLQMTVNEANVNQMASYRNLTHQLVEGMDSVLEALPEVFDSMVENGDVSGAVRLYEELLALIREGAAGDISGMPDAQGNISGMQAGQEDSQGMPGALGDSAALEEGTVNDAGNITGQKEQTGQNPGDSVQALQQDAAQALERAAQKVLQDEILELGAKGMELPGKAMESKAEFQGALEQGAAQQAADEMLQEMDGRADAVISDTLRRAVGEELLKLIDTGQMQTLEGTDIRAQVLQFAQGQGDVQQLFAALNLLTDAGKTSSRALHELEKLFSGKNFRELMTGQLKKFWTVSPRDIASPGKVEDLYRRLDRQLKSLTQTLENAGQSNSTAFKAAASMSQNIDFLQQVNQMYAYVQLPLRLQQGEAHGELYVYSNKKKLTNKDGKISALLHLDMEHLGAVDVYVALQNSKVSTRFYLRDDEMIDFMSGHMELLTSRLQKRGYDCSVAMTIRGEAEEATEGGLEPILRQEKGIMLSQYAFDVRT